jgi:molecular chaperone HtpG
MDAEKGNLSISTENIFPIIKKWLYSEKDIFIRELVANSSDAIAKMRRVVSLGEAEDDGGNWRIDVTVDRDAKTIAISDNGVGMTGEEVRKYINQIAFSGAKEFLEKYKDKAEDAQIIGHFGLGFYSAFMVSSKVQIDTLSWQPGAEAVRWTSDGVGEYEMEPSDRALRGTTVTLHVADDELEYVDRWKMREALVKYFRFLPYEIYLTDAADERKKAAEKKEQKDKKEDEVLPKPINDINPLWNKPAKDCTDEEYKNFYREVFSDYAEPLFWVHLNIDYPFQLKGILYFPRLKNEFDTIEGQVKLYCNQVFVADNIKEVIPEYLLLLKGCIDCPDLPLNVSRSFLQNDGTVKKLSGHITKKVGDKLTGLFGNERDTYCKYWDSINPFIKFGCMRDEKFYDCMKDAIVFKTINDDYKTVKEYLDEFAKAEEAQEPDWEAEPEDHDHEGHDHGHEHHEPKMKTVHRKIVYYVSDAKQQAQYVSMFKAHGLNAVLLNTLIDSHFITFLEMKLNDTRFKRIDSDLTDAVKGGETAVDKEDADALAEIVKAVDGKIKTKIEHLRETGAPAIVLLSEESRRMQEMSRLYAGMDMGGMPEFPADETLVLNADHALVKKLAALARNEGKKEEATLLAAQVHDLAMLSHRPLEPEALAKFLERSAKILERLD